MSHRFVMERAGIVHHCTTEGKKSKMEQEGWRCLADIRGANMSIQCYPIKSSRIYLIPPEVKGDEETKCGCCNWSVRNLYAIARSQADANALFRSGDAGMCGDCLAEMIMNERWIVDWWNNVPEFHKRFSKWILADNEREKLKNRDGVKAFVRKIDEHNFDVFVLKIRR